MVGVVIGMFLFAAPASAGKCVTVECSPGYYKNHVDVWCPVVGGSLLCAPLTTACGGACTCEQLRHLLSAEEGATSAQRAAADACLNDFFSFTAGFSPCVD
jgi:hypothetical protein